ncbi:uncharacterized protein BCR38DRAFT_449008 [Pseudomassariella vexata]|uniref:Uncharacterized protein n=1 Tax=Pseudomassariella vexata TaxID=1141098 RepID=A0A1Y2DF61_9PEZI|nr:uncharacterized protein BCR38DRAFT_449008 [Pseudomassariella vexata]ORY57912.1 hypothetical protein BCR38DRAFT_449008 [Pseudomassariella vexata]
MAPLLNLPAIPTRTLPTAVSKIVFRQATTTVVASDESSSSSNLSGGAIAGIVIGSIIGFLLILWIIRSCTNLRDPEQWGNTFGKENTVIDYYEPPRRHHSRSPRSRSRHSHHSHRGRRSTSVEVRNVSMTRPMYVQETYARSPRAPPRVYHTRDSRDSRRSSRGSGLYYAAA